MRKERLFKEIKKQVKTPKEAIELIDVIKRKAYLYAAIFNPNDDYWLEYPKSREIRQYLSELKLFKVIQPIPLIFAVEEYRKEWLPKLLKMLVSISFRYNVIGKLNPNLMEKVYNKISLKIRSGEIKRITELKKWLKELYVNDDTFVNMFKSRAISTVGQSKNLVKYILTKIENQIAEKEYDFSDANFTIEHILPENYDEKWNEFFSDEADKYIYRLGNYLLLEKRKNKEAGRKQFSEKKEIYKTSQYRLANSEILSYEEWNIDNLNKYQYKLAKYAKSIWKL